MNCKRCRQKMRYLESIKPEEKETDTLTKVLKRYLPDHRKLDLYFCHACKSIELFAPHQAFAPDLNIQISHEQDTSITDIKQLLKLVPNKSNLEDVTDKIGRPFAYHKIESGAVLCFRSAAYIRPHTVVLDLVSRKVTLVAIHNDHGAFDLKNLVEAYGNRNLIMQKQGHKFWMFEEPGVAFLTNEFNDNEVVYVQYFDPAVDFNQYKQLDGFCAKTFMCFDSGRMDYARRSK